MPGTNRAPISLRLLLRKEDLIRTALHQLFRSPQNRATWQHVEMGLLLLRWQAAYGNCCCSAAYLASHSQACPKTYHRFLRRLRRHNLARSWRLHRPDGRRWVNRTDVTRLWYHLVRLLGRLLLEWGAKILNCHQTRTQVKFSYRGSLGYDERRIYSLGPAPPQPAPTAAA